MRSIGPVIQTNKTGRCSGSWEFCVSQASLPHVPDIPKTPMLAGDTKAQLFFLDLTMLAQVYRKLYFELVSRY